MSNDKKNYMRNNIYVERVIKGPEFSTTTPGQLEIYGQIQPSKNKTIVGEAPYGHGEIMNLLTNLDINKKPEVNGQDSSELFQAMYMRLSGVKYNPGGIKLKVIQDNTTYKYVVNTAFEHANLSAVQAKQNMALMQLTEMNWFTNAKAPIKSNVEATTIALLAIPHNTAVILDAFLSLANIYAFVSAMVTDDRDNTAHWQSLQSTFARRTFVSKISLLSATADNLYMSKTAIDYISSLKKLNKGSKGLNTPYTTIHLNFDEQVNNLRINTTGQDIDFESATSFAIDFKEEVKAFEIEQVIRLVEKVAGKNPNAVSFTIKGQTVTVQNFRELIDFYEATLSSMQVKISSLIAINADFYAALAVIHSTGILNSDFQKNSHIVKNFTEAMKVYYNLNHIAMLTTATTYHDMDIEHDERNNVSMNVPTVLNLKPYRDFDDNGILLFIDTGSTDYIPVLDWLKTRIDYIIPWCKKNNGQDGAWIFRKYEMKHDTFGIPYMNFQSKGATDNDLEKRIQYNIMNKLSPWLTNYSYRIAGSDAAPTLFYMRSPVITRFLRFSYKSIASKVVDDAPLAIGLNKVSPLDAFNPN